MNYKRLLFYFTYREIRFQRERYNVSMSFVKSTTVFREKTRYSLILV